MSSADLNRLADVLGVSYVGENCSFSTVVTDSRSLQAGEVFLALKGPNFDGHKFAQKAQQLGAKALIVESKQDVEIPQFIVENSRLALGQLGAAVMAHVKPKTVAMTGSVGKTTVKEMTAAILSQLGDVLATQGNFNNDIGLPLTLLNLKDSHSHAVLELGMNHAGEIAELKHMINDGKFIRHARTRAFEIIENDPKLTNHQKLKNKLLNDYKHMLEFVNIG